MKIFDWFKPSNKKNVVIPSENVGPLRGAELIRAFSTEDEPKCKDFPKEKFKVYWEIFVDAIPGGYGAVVRFNAFDNSFQKEHQLTSQDLMSLRKNVSMLILETMDNNKR